MSDRVPPRDAEELWRNILEAGVVPEANSPAGTAEFVQQATAILEQFDRLYFEAPAWLVGWARNLITGETGRLKLARLLPIRSVPASRLRSKNIAEVFALGDVELRLIRAEVHDGWSLMGELSEGGWRIRCAGRTIASKDGRFEFVVPSSTETLLVLTKGDESYCVPALEE